MQTTNPAGQKGENSTIINKVSADNINIIQTRCISIPYHNKGPLRNIEELKLITHWNILCSQSYLVTLFLLLRTLLSLIAFCTGNHYARLQTNKTAALSTAILTRVIWCAFCHLLVKDEGQSGTDNAKWRDNRTICPHSRMSTWRTVMYTESKQDKHHWELINL